MEEGLFLELAARAKLSNRGRRALGKRGDEEPDGHWLSSRDPVWRREKLPEEQPSLQNSTDLGFMAEWPDGKLLLSEIHMKARLKSAKKHLKD